MTSSRFDPLGLWSAPADVAHAIRALPELVERLDRIVENTDGMNDVRQSVSEIRTLLEAMSEISGEVERIGAATSSLPALHRAVDAIAKSTGSLGEVKDNTGEIATHTIALRDVNERIGDVASAIPALPEIERRLGTIEAAMPVLVEVQQHLARLPDVIETLGGDLAKLSDLLALMLTSLDRLDGSVVTLQGSVEPLGRIANRLPGRGSRRSEPDGGTEGSGVDG